MRQLRVLRFHEEGSHVEGDCSKLGPNMERNTAAPSLLCSEMQADAREELVGGSVSSCQHLQGGSLTSGSRGGSGQMESRTFSTLGVDKHSDCQETLFPGDTEK